MCYLSGLITHTEHVLMTWGVDNDLLHADLKLVAMSSSCKLSSSVKASMKHDLYASREGNESGIRTRGTKASPFAVWFIRSHVSLSGKQRCFVVLQMQWDAIIVLASTHW